MSLENASDEVKLAVDLIMLLESHQIPAQTVLSALEIVRRDYANKLKTRKAGRKTQRSRMLSPAVCWQSGPLRMTPLETILMEKVSQTPHDAVFRQMLMHQAVAKDFLQLYLPRRFWRSANWIRCSWSPVALLKRTCAPAIPISFTHCARVMDRAMCTR